MVSFAPVRLRFPLAQPLRVRGHSNLLSQKKYVLHLGEIPEKKEAAPSLQNGYLLVLGFRASCEPRASKRKSPRALWSIYMLSDGHLGRFLHAPQRRSVGVKLRSLKMVSHANA